MLKLQDIPKERAGDRIKVGLADVRDTVTLAHKFVYLLSICGIENVDTYLTCFREIYSSCSYYQGVKNTIIHEVESIGLSPYHVADYL